MESTKHIFSCQPVAPYLGGKRALAKRLISVIEQIPHDTYAEPFVGMGGVFLRRRTAPRAEVINDINRDVYTLFRVLQDHYGYFVDYLRFRLTSRYEFIRLVETDPAGLTDIQRAARFLYLQRTAFGGKISGRNFGVSPDRPGRFDVTKLTHMLDDVHTRLSGVIVECLPYAEFIRRYDRAGTLFYLDPPYWGCERDYGAVFERSDFERLAEILSGLEGRFLLSLNDRPEVREVFKEFRIDSVETTYSVAKTTTQRVGEVIITNCDG